MSWHVLLTCLQALQSQLGPLVDIILSPSPDEENSEAVGNFLDRSQELSGTGATLALALLDMGWSMPAPIRPKLGDRVFAVVFEALRRYGLFTRCRSTICGGRGAGGVATCHFRFGSASVCMYLYV